MKLIDLRMNDGSRHFAVLPEVVPWSVMRDHIATLPDTTVNHYVADGVTEAWIDFTYRGYKFSVNTQLGEFWFFVSDPCCPEFLLSEVASHCEKLASHV